MSAMACLLRSAASRSFGETAITGNEWLSKKGEQERKEGPSRLPIEEEEKLQKVEKIAWLSQAIFAGPYLAESRLETKKSWRNRASRLRKVGEIELCYVCCMAIDPVSKFIRRKYPYPNAAIEDRLLDRSAMQERWGCSFETLKRLERSGILKPIRLGGKVRYRLSDVLIAEREGEVIA